MKVHRKMQEKPASRRVCALPSVTVWHAREAVDSNLISFLVNVISALASHRPVEPNLYFLLLLYRLWRIIGS